MDELIINKQLQHKIDSMITEEIAKHGNPGFSFGIVHKNKLIYSGNYGLRNWEEKLETNENTLYMIASVTKSFVCTTIMRLVEKGKMSVDDPISKYFDIELGVPQHPILVRHLMNHSSGIPDIADTLAIQNMEEELGLTDQIPKIPFYTWDDIERHLRGAQEFISAKPGERFYYNNLAYGMLAKIIEQASGMSFEEAVKKEVLDPLEMPNSQFNEPELRTHADLAVPYRTAASSKSLRNEPTIYVREPHIRAAGGLFSSITEMANYAIMHINQGLYKGTQFLTADSIKQIHDFQFRESYPNQDFGSGYGDYGKTGYGFGFAVHDDFFGKKLVQHSGSYIGSSAWLAMLPQEELAVICLSNKHPSPRMFAQAILMELMGIDSKTNFHLLVKRAHNKKLSGYYEGYKNVYNIKVLSKAGVLYFSDNTGGEYLLIPYEDGLEPMKFYLLTEIGGKMGFDFEIDENGTVWAHFERNKLKKIKDL